MDDFLISCMADLVFQIIENDLENYFATIFMMVY